MALLTISNIGLLNDSIIKSLKNNNIYNVLDLIQEDTERLVNITKLNYKDVLGIRNYIFKKYASPAIKGSIYHGKLLTSFAILPTCILRLDDILQGGLRCGKITEICGLPDSGKTQLCMSIASNISKIFNQDVLYIDTKNDFTGVRMHQILQEKCSTADEVNECLERIKVLRIWNLKRLISFLHDIQLNKDFMKNIRLIVLDSLPALMLQFKGEKNKDSLGLLNHFVNVVRFICVENNIPFIATNLLLRWVESKPGEIGDDSHSIETKPALGKYWKHAPYASLRLEKCKVNAQVINLCVSTCNWYVEKSAVSLNISSDGVT